MSGLIAGLRKLREDEVNEFRLLRRFLQQSDIPHAAWLPLSAFIVPVPAHQDGLVGHVIQIPLTFD